MIVELPHWWAEGDVNNSGAAHGPLPPQVIPSVSRELPQLPTFSAVPLLFVVQKGVFHGSDLCVDLSASQFGEACWNPAERPGVGGVTLWFPLVLFAGRQKDQAAELGELL